MGDNILRRAAGEHTTRRTRAPTAEISRQELHGLIGIAGGAAHAELEPELELVDAAEATPVVMPAPSAPRFAHTLRRDPPSGPVIGRPTRVMSAEAAQALAEGSARALPSPAGGGAQTIDREVRGARSRTAQLARPGSAVRMRRLLLIALLAAAFAEVAFLALRAVFHA